MNPNGRPLGDGFAAAMSNLTLRSDPARRPHTPIANMSHGEAMREIGRLESRLDAKETEISELKREREGLLRNNADVHVKLTEVKAKLQMVQKDRDSLVQELTNVNEVLKARDVAMKKMTDDMAKAQKTIKVQSDQIATPSTSNKPPMTPHRATNPTYAGTPPSYHGHRDAPSSNYLNAPTTYPPPMPRQRSAQMPGGDSFQSTAMTRQPSGQRPGQEPFQPPPMTRQASTQMSSGTSFQTASSNRQPSGQIPGGDPFLAPPMNRQPSAQRPGQDPFLSAPGSRKPSIATPAEATLQTVRETYQSGQIQPSIFNGRRGSAIPPTTGYNSFGARQIATVPNADTFTINMNAQHTNLFKEVEQWAQNYANVPNQELDEIMPLALFETLRNLTNPDGTIHLISTSTTRHFSVAKLINSSLVNFPLRPLLVKGFTPEYDAKIADIRVQLSQVGLPIHVRRALLVASAEVVQEMMKSAGFNRWIDRMLDERIHRMWLSLEPLCAPGVDRGEAWEGLTHIWREAVRVGLLQLTKASTFTLDFPPYGPNSRFNPSNMISRDSNFMQNSQTLGQMGVCVRVAVTPIVTETNFMTDAVIPRNLHYANVLLQL